MKHILGLDLGTNSIGWAKISIDENNVVPEIKLGSRIIPMSQDVLGKFDSGVTESQTAVRTGYRGARRLRERCLLRRERLFRVLHLLHFLPEHFEKSIGWDKNNGKTYGKFIDESEPKLAWSETAEGQKQFIFMDAFNEMLSDFKQHNPQLVADGHLVPLDWTIFYLRDKALRQQISKHELAWIILNFNQKRGYYQLRGEEEEVDESKVEEYMVLKIVDVEATNDKRGDNVWYNLRLENGWTYRRQSKLSLADWKGKTREFIVTTEYNPDGTIKLDKEGLPKRSFRAPKDDDWTLQKKKIEKSICDSGESVGSFIYHHLLSAPFDKIRGKLVRTIERDFYKAELEAILKKQSEYHQELTDNKYLEACVKELYAKNIAHQQSLMKKDMLYFLVNDIIFYQRPLKSKKSLISDCPYEVYKYVDKETGEIKTQHIKCSAKSNPYFQEFRLWQFIQNLRLFDCSSIEEKEVTSIYLQTEEDYVRLFNYLNDKKEITQDTLLKDFFKVKKPKGKDTKMPVRWNYVIDKPYPCNDTRYILLSALKKAQVDTSLIDNGQIAYRLWHLLYSVEDQKELTQALTAFAKQYNLGESFVEVFKKVAPFKKEYGAYSEKAIKKLLSVMRTGSMWDGNQVPETVEQIIKGDIDEKIKARMSHQGFSFKDKDDFKFLPVWLACYVIYGRHSESQDVTRWENPAALQSYINSFKQYSLRNPIVEQVVLEALRTVHDIWKECGHIDEIHVELGRSMKSTADQRKRMTDRNSENEKTNMRIKLMLLELKNDPSISEVRPYSPIQQEILRIYEEGALQELSKEDEDYTDISYISHLATPTPAEITRYKLWLEQKYCSPYTGRPISLSKLFTTAYQIEHVIPQGRFFDDSLSNKVICEAEVNQRKTNMLGMEFIRKCGGEIIHCPMIGDVRVFKEDEYKQFIKDHYSTNKVKARKLLMDDVPEEFIQRQMNDSRYISKVIIGLLSKVVREESEIDATSKNVIPCTGGITERLKKDWGLKDKWNELITPRFQRMNQLTQSDAFGHWENKDGKRVFQTILPLELRIDKKRIDHRHHAMDALVIALASRNIISYLNNESARDTQRREDLRQLLCDKNRHIRKPWNTFTEDAYAALQNIVVSFKHYIRVINKASNYYEHYNEEGKKVFIPQHGESQWAVRKPLHKETVFGQVNLRRKKTVPLNKAVENVDFIVDKTLKKQIQTLLNDDWNNKQIVGYLKKTGITKVEVYFFTNDEEPMVAVRKPLDDSFDKKRIESITDTGIQTILLNYLDAKCNDPKIAFSPEGIMEMNQHIADYNNGKPHQPILRVRVSEPKGEKYNIGLSGINRKKFVEAQSGTNLYYAIYEDQQGRRSYQTIPLNEVVERQKQGLAPVPEYNEDNEKLKFYLSPNDLVYVPTEDELINNSTKIAIQRVYRFVDSSKTTANFVPASAANLIFHVKKEDALKYSKAENLIQDEFGVGSPQSKNQKTLDGQMIKSICWKLEVDRLGNIINIIR